MVSGSFGARSLLRTFVGLSIPLEAATTDTFKFHRTVLYAALVCHVVTAWYSSGYHIADEHFQIIAFAQWKMGDLAMIHLPWEFEEGIRSSLQPWIAVVVFKAAEFLGLGDPFTGTFVLRLLTALFTLVVVRGFVWANMASVAPQLQRPFILLSYFLWFLPFLHVRFCSETWAGAFLLLALTTAQGAEKDRWWALKIGAFLALTISLRPATIPAVGGFVLWLLIIRRSTLPDILRAVIAGSLVLAISALLDTVFYGKPSFSLARYIDANFPSHPGHVFDDFPWYYYFPWIVKYMVPPIGTVVLLSLGLLIWRRPKHPITWCIVPLVLALSIVPHKELRFLYPLADLVPLALVFGLNELWPLLRTTIVRWSAIGLLGLCLVVNIAGLAVVMTTAAGIGRTVLAKELHHVAEPGDRIGYLLEPDIAWRIALPNFYRPKGTEEVAFVLEAPDPTVGELDYLIARPADAEAFSSRHDLPLHPMASTESRWVEQLMQWYTWNEGPQPWTLYRAGPDRR